MGMRQRLELATALLGDPDVLILDEPSNGLDPQGIAWLRDFMRYLAGEGRTVLVSSHLLAEMAQTIDDAVIVSFGQLKARGTLEEITSGMTGMVMRARTPAADRLCSGLTCSIRAKRRKRGCFTCRNPWLEPSVLLAGTDQKHSGAGDESSSRLEDVRRAQHVYPHCLGKVLVAP